MIFWQAFPIMIKNIFCCFFFKNHSFSKEKCWPIYYIAGLQVVIETVDSFQGKQMDVVIMSCVRASEPGLQTGIGFVSDIRRLNVAITRAKRGLWILGSAATLKVSNFLKHLRNVEMRLTVPRRF